MDMQTAYVGYGARKVWHKEDRMRLSLPLYSLGEEIFSAVSHGVGALFGAGRDRPYPARLRRRAARGVILWDVLRAAHRPGSLDSAIHPRRLEPNAIPALLARHPELERIVFNGAPAEALFRRHVAKKCGARLAALELVRLPSTSPAHAARTFAQKLAAWRNVLGAPPPGRGGPATHRLRANKPSRMETTTITDSRKLSRGGRRSPG